MISIGLIDFDAIAMKRYVAPNYDLGITYAYLRKDKNINVRLVTSLSPQNLAKYDQLLIFKLYPYIKHPSSMIRNYYNYNIQEYGPGFINREKRPNFLETFYTTPDFTCYNPILKLSIERPKHKLSWSTNRTPTKRKHQQVRLFEDFNDEWLRRDVNFTSKYLVVHDRPDMLINRAEQKKVVEELLTQGYRLFFSQPLDISLITDTNILEQVVTQPAFRSLRCNLMASTINDTVLWLINYYITHKGKKTDVVILLDKERPNSYFPLLLQLHYYNYQTNYYLRLRPFWDKDMITNDKLVYYVYRFLYEKPYRMSLYEYIYFRAYINHVPQELLKRDEEMYEYVFQNYGFAPILQEIEDWLLKHPEYEEHFFIGGTSNYVKQRRKYYDPRRSNYAFSTSTN